MMNNGLDNKLKIEGTSLENLGIKAAYTITLTAGENGTVSGGGTYAEGTVVTITATPNDGYKFSQWSDGDTNASRQITVSENVSLSATFEEEQKETWYFNDSDNLTSTITIDLDINFTSNEVKYTSLYGRTTGSPGGQVIIYYINETSHTSAWSHPSTGSGWKNQAYRTIILDEPATGDLLTFLQTNATKQS